jgi:GNAT superfamily N-acetyltransferase
MNPMVRPAVYRQWERILRLDEANQAYFAERVALPQIALFRSEREDAPEFDVAVVYRVARTEADAALLAVKRYFRGHGRRARVRLSPVSAPADWPRRLMRAGFAETGDRLDYFSVPETVRLAASPAVDIRRAVSAEESDVFSAIQVAGFALPAEHHAWERDLFHRHLAARRHSYYLAAIDGQPVGAARSIRWPNGITALAALATLPEARGHGVGTSLLARMIEDARMAGSRTIFGTVIPGSDADRMYARRGFARLFATRTYADGA